MANYFTVQDGNISDYSIYAVSLTSNSLETINISPSSYTLNTSDSYSVLLSSDGNPINGFALHLSSVAPNTIGLLSATLSGNNGSLYTEIYSISGLTNYDGSNNLIASYPLNWQLFKLSQPFENPINTTYRLNLKTSSSGLMSIIALSTASGINYDKMILSNVVSSFTISGNDIHISSSINSIYTGINYTNTGAVSVASSPFAGSDASLMFSNSSQYLTIPNTMLLSGDYTVEFWAYPSSSSYVEENWISFKNYDKYEIYNILHINADVLSSGLNNKTFLDNSSYNSVLTSGGTPSQGIVSPFYPNGWSYYQSANNSILFLSSAPTNALDFGTGNFTIEFWIYPTASATVNSSGIIASQDNGGVGALDGWVVTWSSANQIGINDYSAGSIKFSIYATGAITLNRWHHIAICRYGTSTNQTLIFVDGVLSASGTVANSVPFSTSNQQITIGNWRFSTDPARSFPYGYISNLRVVKGTALYTSGFIPPTSPLTNVAGTSLLTLQDVRYKDNSNNNLTISPNVLSSAASLQPFSPFVYNNYYDPNKDAGSGYFNGTTDYIAAPPSAGNLESNFTVEFWMKNSSTGSWVNALGTQSIIGNTTAGIWRLNVRSNSQNNLGFSYSTGSAFVDLIYSTRNINDGYWHHVAFCRANNSLSGYLDGVYLTAFSVSQSLISNQNLNISRDVQNGTYYTGYLSNIRIVTGVTVYTGNFTPPFLPLSTSGATSSACYASTTNINTTFPANSTIFLTNFNNANIIDKTYRNTLTTINSVSTTTATKKYGTGSLYFNLGDYISIPYSSLNEFGSLDYTIECWINSTSTTQYGHLISKYSNSIGAGYWRFEINNSSSTAGDVAFWVGEYSSSVPMMTTTGQKVTDGKWHHIAVVRNGSNHYIFIDGIIRATATSSYTMLAVNHAFNCGAAGNSFLERYTGYIDDMRVTKGIARYTSSFVPAPRTNDCIEIGMNYSGISSSNSKLYASNNIITNASVSSINYNQWNHIALTRKNNVVVGYVNGVSALTYNDKSIVYGNLTVGSHADLITGSISGNISNLRISNSAIYSENFTVPTSRLSNNTSTQLLIQSPYTNTYVYYGVISNPSLDYRNVTANNTTISNLYIHNKGALNFPLTSTTLTINGSAGLQITSDGTLNIGTSSSVIPLSTTHSIILSNTPIDVHNGGNFNAYGYPKSTTTNLVSTYQVGSNTFTTTDNISSNWKIGDILSFKPNISSRRSFDELTLNSFVAPNAFTTTSNSLCTHTGSDDQYGFIPDVYNLSRNIIIQPLSSTNKTAIRTIDAANLNLNYVQLSNIRINLVNKFNTLSGVTIITDNQSYIKDKTLQNLTINNTILNKSNLLLSSISANNINFSNNYILSSNNNGLQLINISSYNIKMYNNTIIGSLSYGTYLYNNTLTGTCGVLNYNSGLQGMMLSGTNTGTITGGSINSGKEGIYIDASTSNLNGLLFKNIITNKNTSVGFKVSGNNLNYLTPIILNINALSANDNLDVGIEAYNITGNLSNIIVNNNLSASLKISIGNNDTIIDGITSIIDNRFYLSNYNMLNILSAFNYNKTIIKDSLLSGASNTFSFGINLTANKLEDFRLENCKLLNNKPFNIASSRNKLEGTYSFHNSNSDTYDLSSIAINLYQTDVFTENGLCVMSENSLSSKHYKYLYAGKLSLDDTLAYYENVISEKLEPFSNDIKLRSSSKYIPMEKWTSISVSVYIYKSTTPLYSGSAPRLMLKRNAALGYDDTVLATSTGPAGTWELLNATLPNCNDTGIAEVYIDCSGSIGSGTINIDNWNFL